MNNNVKGEIKRLERSIRRLKKKTDKLERGITRRLGRSYRDVINAIHAGLDDKDVCTIRKSIARIDNETGGLVDYLVYFPEYDMLRKTVHYLEAYLITNRDVLEEKEIGELESLIRHISHS